MTWDNGNLNTKRKSDYFVCVCVCGVGVSNVTVFEKSGHLSLKFVYGLFDLAV
jgi:hypothetical protein